MVVSRLGLTSVTWRSHSRVNTCTQYDRSVDIDLYGAAIYVFPLEE